MFEDGLDVPFEVVTVGWAELVNVAHWEFLGWVVVEQQTEGDVTAPRFIDCKITLHRKAISPISWQTQLLHYKLSWNFNF